MTRSTYGNRILLCLLFAALFAGGATVSSAHADSCPNASFRTGASSALPDCRAYELVSPVEKNGAYIATESYIGSPEGESIGFTSTSGFAGATSDLKALTGYQSNREGAGWATAAQTQSEAQFIDRHGLAEDEFGDVSFGNVQTSEQCQQGVAAACALERGVRVWLLQEASQPESDLSVYLTRGDGPLERLGPAVPATASGLAESREKPIEGQLINVRGMSADASHIVFEDTEPAGPNQWSFSGPVALLEYAGTGHTEPLPLVPDPATEENGCPQQLLGGVVPQPLSDFKLVKNPISTDGRRIFFTESNKDPEYPQCHGGLFARVDNGEENPHTVPISEPASAECALCDTAAGVRQPAEFVGASEDGSKVFFNTSQPLLDGTSGLYEYDFDAPAGDMVTLVAAGSVAVQQISEDGSHVYFTSSNVLTEEPSSGVRGRNKTGQPVDAGAVAQAGEPNLYVFEQDERYPSGHVGFVATINQVDIFTPTEKVGDVTPDGRFLVFASRAQLTPDDSSTASQIFEYDSLTGRMIRVSIGQGGESNNGNSYLSYPGAVYPESVKSGEFQLFDSNDATIPSKNTAAETSFSPSVYVDDLSVSKDGAYVFFASPIGLTPQALNRAFIGTAVNAIPIAVFARNVSEYHAGEVSLISDGKDLTTHNERSQVHLLGASLSGRDVFFETVDPLVGQDTDSNKDIYDARIGGGFPGPVQPIGCSGDACQGQLSPSPVLLSPGSEFQAGGNPTSPPSPPAAKPKPTALTNAEKLAAALKGCRKAPKSKRAKCEAAARKKYTPVKRTKK